MILPMARIRILGPRTVLDDVAGALQALGTVHVESAAEGAPPVHPDISLLRPHAPEAEIQQLREKLEAVLSQVRKILSVLPAAPEASGIPAGPPAAAADIDGAALRELAPRLSADAARVETLLAKRRAHEDELSLLSRYDKVLAVLSPLMSEVGESRDLECLGLAIQARERRVIPLLEEALGLLTGGHYETFFREADRETLAGLLVFPRENAAAARALLWERNIGEIRLPASVADKPLREAVEIIRRKKAMLPERIARLDRELAALSKRRSGPLRVLERRIENRIGQIAVSASFYETRMAFALYGFAPRKEVPRIREALAERFGPVVLLEELPVSREEEERIPVSLVNRPLARPFEIFTRILPLPRYGTIDPTPLVALFFPLFYGIIIGDIGYGLVLLGLAAWARRRFRAKPLVRDLATIFAWASLSAVLWGAAYGELFGNLGEAMGLRPLLFRRMGDFLTTIYFAAGIGGAHVLLGIALGIACSWRRRRRRELFARATGFVLVCAFLAAGAGLLGMAPPSFIPWGSAVALACVPVLVAGAGPRAAMEIHNIVNVLSYLRIMGIGVASAALAYAANALAALPGSVVTGIAAGAALHAVNLAFGVLSPAIQSLRLHYVEFFENFFAGGGTAYRPFKGIA